MEMDGESTESECPFYTKEELAALQANQAQCPYRPPLDNKPILPPPECPYHKKLAAAAATTTAAKPVAVAPPPAPVAAENAEEAAEDGEGGTGEKEIFRHPETGEIISKSLYKKLLKGGGVKKEKKEKPVAKPENKEKKEKAAAAKEKKEQTIYSDDTPVGEFKRIQNFFPESYQPKYVEAAWQSWWEQSGFYKPNVKDALEAEDWEKFVMVIPPPNVTGSLHLGHGLTTAIEDTLTRWNRMRGKITLWVPGVDHAGIATQSVVERRLMKNEGLSRRDLGREKFVEKVWEWKETYGNRITTQQRYLGASVDWGREAFTMSPTLSRAVTEAFCKFHEDGLLYRDNRLINWSCALQSALSDIEVDFLDLKGRTLLSVPGHKLQDKYEFGVITSFAYKVDGTDEEIVVATTRLETMLGDTAVAVHPDDPRYTHLHGKFLVHPFVDRKIPIVTDGTLVDMTFGTGAVKVTPAHDPNDYACGKRNNLEFIIVFTSDGRIAENGGQFAGMLRYDARVAMEAALKERGLYRGKEENAMRLGLCSRTGDIIEPMLTPQWYVNCSSMAKRAVDAVRNGEMKIVPEMHESTWYMWLENIKDWCISRQLWWGHRIPAYFARLPGETSLSVDHNDMANNNRWFVARTEAEALSAAAKALNVSESEITLSQDEDVLDTWFSSGLFPFSVFGWPEVTDDFKAFFPTTILETGLDILFFWVARMVMMSLHLTDQLPFKTVYLHAMVRDKYGRKMSKALGNVIDPLEVISGCSLEDLLKKIDEGNLPEKEVATAKAAQTADFPQGIPECGTDALRFGLLAYTLQGRDINLDLQRIVGYRQFCNKIWNAFRFACTYVDDFIPLLAMNYQIMHSLYISPRDRFILARISATTKEVNYALATYQFAAATTSLHSFFMYDFCDVYLELVKPVLSDRDPEKSMTYRRTTQATLYCVLEQFLRLLHPIMPFLTEELWQRLPLREHYMGMDTIMLAPYPKPIEEWDNPEIEESMHLIKEAIHSARSLRVQYKIANHIKANFYFKSENEKVKTAVEAQADDFCTLAKGNFLKFFPSSQEVPKGYCIQVVSDQLSLLVDLTGLIDVDTEIVRLTKDVERLNPMIVSYQRKMTAKDYNTKVPPDVQQSNQEKLNAYQAELEETQRALQMFQSMKL